MRGPSAPVAITRKVEDVFEIGVNDHLIARCNDGTIWFRSLQAGDTWEEILPPPGCKHSSGVEQ